MKTSILVGGSNTRLHPVTRLFKNNSYLKINIRYRYHIQKKHNRLVDGYLLFTSQTINYTIKAVKNFERIEDKFNYKKIRNHALKFNKDRFKKEISNFVKEKVQEKFGGP